MELKPLFVFLFLFLTHHVGAQAGGEFNGPFPSWLNVKTISGAKGDGHTDDTRALQSALTAVAGGDKYNTLYIPAGVYLVSKTLLLNSGINISMIGADPEKTIIKWTGEAQGTMFRFNGVAYSKFDRITFDGNSIAGVAVEQSWDGIHPHFDTANEYADDIFTDVGFGIHGGHLGHGFAETTVLRDRFISNSRAGISLGNFNALDIWVRDCLFDHCTQGVTNSFGAGNFKVYHCLFLHSSDSDLSMGNTGEFSVRDNTSIGSSRFFSAGYTRNPACIIITGNIILDPLQNPAITVGNQGPVIFMNNTIRSVAGSKGRVATFHSDCLATDNTFTVNDPVDPGDRGIVKDNLVVLTTQLKSITLPSPVPFEPEARRKVFEVPEGADAALIQGLIGQASKLAGKRPVIHFPFGTYKISTTLVIPPGSDMQLTGDGFGDQYASTLRWSGGARGTLLRIAGNCSATIKDITLRGDTGTVNVQIEDANKRGSLVFLREFHQQNGQTGIFADHIGQGAVFGEDIGLSGLTTAVKITGPGRMVIYDGAESNNAVSHEVSGGADLAVLDCWYEGSVKSVYAALSGNSDFLAAGDHVAVLSKTMAVTIHDFSGAALFVADDLTGLPDESGKSEDAKLFVLGVLAEDETFFQKSFGAMMMNRTRNHGSTLLYGGSLAAADLGPDPRQFIREIQLKMEEKFPPGDPKTTITLDRVMSINGKIGLDIAGGDTNNRSLAQ